MTQFFKDSTILVTGGTGSFGKRFAQMTLAMHDPKKIIIFSRDEMKQEEMAKQFPDDNRLRFFLGDVRDKDRLHRACQGVDYIVHAAALKIVPIAEYNPFETIKTNVIGAMNVIDCAINQGIKRVIALSTDKASNPVNLYGATKLCSDKLFISANAYAGAGPTRFSVVRYGNVVGSRGSVVPLFMKLATQGAKIPVTHPDMTRFMITLDQGINLVYQAFEDSLGGEVYVLKIPSMKVTDIVKAIAPNAEMEFIGIRPGEKMHEQMISIEDVRTTFEYEDYYKIYPQISWSNLSYMQMESEESPVHTGKLCAPDFIYTSDTNTQWMSPMELRNLLKTDYSSLVIQKMLNYTVPQ